MRWLARALLSGVLLLGCDAQDPGSLTGRGPQRSGSSSSASSSGSEGVDTPAPGSSGTSASSSSTSSTSSSSSGSSSGATTPAGFHELCVTKINAYRATKGLPPYARWTQGETCADGQSKSDAESGVPHGAFPGCGEFAQNECPGFSGAPEQAIDSCLALMWAEGPGGGHHDTMASTQHEEVACGLFVTDGGAIWSVQNFR